jgi:hypothetical protein
MPDTRTPYYAVYTIVAVAYSGYALSIWLRARRLRLRRAALTDAKNRSAAAR